MTGSTQQSVVGVRQGTKVVGPVDRRGEWLAPVAENVPRATNVAASGAGWSGSVDREAVGAEWASACNPVLSGLNPGAGNGLAEQALVGIAGGDADQDASEADLPLAPLSTPHPIGP
jgi:hypothetical protein